MACSRISSVVSPILRAGKLRDMVTQISVNMRQAGGAGLACNVLLDSQQLLPAGSSCWVAAGKTAGSEYSWVATVDGVDSRFLSLRAGRQQYCSLQTGHLPTQSQSQRAGAFSEGRSLCRCVRRGECPFQRRASFTKTPSVSAAELDINCSVANGVTLSKTGPGLAQPRPARA